MVLERNVLTTDNFEFPYTDLRFPGMNTGERILFVTRESSLTHWFRIGLLTLMVISIFLIGSLLLVIAADVVPQVEVVWIVLGLLCVMGWGIGWWWVTSTFKKSVFIITTRRLTKIIHTTPFNWYQFSLGLDEIEDTGSYAASFFEALFGLGYFVARSGAAAIKNFKIINITFAADLHNYVNKLLYAFKHHPGLINEFRPFIPHLKGEKRNEFLQKFPEYKTEF